ncbi:ribulose-phosphate 3-epimerase [Shouchella shacheensis]|uniref:ribulose-phosphate 3-epimerase n=1 Tax=Shouchella shacheensis TaxID=1649580 RepID=UPI00073FDC17|nr:ribulose-phosphate 3-epimerase [Shouchella shacheensis]
MIKVAPSILAGDFANMGDCVARLEKAGADYIHVDVMDGHFVPSITFGPQMVKAIRPYTNLPLDVHLMIEKPDEQIAAFKEAGADLLSVHVETCTHLHRTISAIKEVGMKAGVVLNPATPASFVEPVLGEVDLVLQMTVNPGFGGQAFIPSTLQNIKKLRAIILANHLDVEIEVDGGVNQKSAKLCREAGANVLVAGSAVLGANDIAEAIKEIRG